MSNVQRVSPLGRFAFGNLVEISDGSKGDPHWLCALEVQAADSHPLIELIGQTVDEGYSDPKLGKLWPKDQNQLIVPYKQATRRVEGSEEREVNPDALLFKFKRRGTIKRDGAEVANTPPVIIGGATGKPLAPHQIPPIGYGTTGVVVFQCNPYSVLGKHGVSLRLLGFQIQNLVEHGQLTQLPAMEGAWAPADEAESVDLSQLMPVEIAS